LEGNDLELLLVVTLPEPGRSPPSEVSPTIPDEPVLSHWERAHHRLLSVLLIALNVLGFGMPGALPL
jgi:hypothetical protein